MPTVIGACASAERSAPGSASVADAATAVVAGLGGNATLEPPRVDSYNFAVAKDGRLAHTPDVLTLPFIGRSDVISLGVGEPDKPTPWPIREAVIRSLEKGQTTYTSNLGLESLRVAISDYVTKQFRVTYDPKTEILVTVGVSEALDIAFRAVLNPGDEVIYHEPCYVSYSPSIKMAYGVPVVAATFASAAAVATGLASVAAMNGEPTRVLCWAGDGGTSRRLVGRGLVSFSFAIW